MRKMKSKTTLVVATNSFIKFKLLKALLLFYCFAVRYTESIKICMSEKPLPRRSKVTIWTLRPTVDFLFWFLKNCGTYLAICRHTSP